MAAILFKRRYLPNIDGSDSATALTDGNTAFVHTYQGDDLTGDGTRAKPYKTINKAGQKSGISYILFRGVPNEYFSYPSLIMIGDDINQTFITANFTPNFRSIYTATVDKINGSYSGWYYTMYAVIINGDWLATTAYITSSKVLMKGLRINSANGSEINCTINKYNYGYQSQIEVPSFKNNIIYGYFNYSNLFYSGIQKNNIFLSSTIFKYLGVSIIQPNWTNDSKANTALLRAALITAGMTSANALLLFPQDSFGNETCRIVKEVRAGGTCKNIFNRYADNLTGTISAAIAANASLSSITLTVADSSKFPTTGDIFIPNSDGSGSEVFTYTGTTINSGTSITFTGSSYTFKVAHSNGATCTRYGDVLDFNLNSDPLNEALFASDIGGYVGCFKAATPVSSAATDQFGNVINVNADGSDTADAGTLLLKNSDGSLTFATGQSQTWNRTRSNVITIPVGKKFNGLGSMTQDGSPFGYTIGKFQNLVDPVGLTPSNSLATNTWYRVCNVTVGTYQAVVFNGVTYPPDYFFYSGSITSFTLLNSDSGTVVKKVLASPMESQEIIPYDNLTTPSVSLPKFSAPLMGDCKMLFYKAGNTYGKTAGIPVLFGDAQVAAMTDKISYYLGATMATGWAVTNVDQEFVSLASDTTNYYYDYPVFKYFAIEVNGHFYADYDQ